MEHRLLFLRINKIYDRYIPQKKQSWRIFEYEHVGRQWKADDHEFSPDKKKYTNCYDELELDHFYIILSSKVPGKIDQLGKETFHRWVWSGCMEMTEKQMRKTYDFFSRHKQDIKETIKFAEALRNPTINVDLIEQCFDME